MLCFLVNKRLMIMYVGLKSYFFFSRFFLKQQGQNFLFLKNQVLAYRRFCSDHHYDIVINGGGIVGLALLKLFLTSPFLNQKKILLLEQQKKVIFKPLNQLVNEEKKLSNRVSSITLASKHLFEDIDIWNEISSFAKPISLIHTWAYDYNKKITFSPKKPSVLDNYFYSPTLLKKAQDENYVCYVVENEIINTALNEALNNDLIRYEAKLTDINSKNSFIELTLNQKEKVTTSLLIACDGYNSFVRQKSSISYFNYNLKQAAIVGTIKTERQNDLDQNNVAMQRFVPHLDCVLAILPLTKTYSSFVLSVPQNLVQDLMSMEDENFVNILNEALFYQSESNQNSALISLFRSFDNFFSKLISSQNQLSSYISPPQVLSLEPGSRACFDLHFGTTLPYMVGNFYNVPDRKFPIIGDAAHRVHPLAGQGLNLGLGDAQALFDCLHFSASNGEDLFSKSELSIIQLNETLLRFERRRVLKLITMINAISAMKDLFFYLPSHWLLAFNNFECLKNEVVRFANAN